MRSNSRERIKESIMLADYDPRHGGMGGNFTSKKGEIESPRDLRSLLEEGCCHPRAFCFLSMSFENNQAIIINLAIPTRK